MLEILKYIKDAKYPSGYAGSLKNKINLEDKKFTRLKTHDCHVILQRLLPVYIRPYLPRNVVDPPISLSHWFRRIYCREFKKEGVRHMKLEIGLDSVSVREDFSTGILHYNGTSHGSPSRSNLFKRPVHYSWMYPMERQLGK
ncbi:unnamed protein product [Rhodiola kirilowii]